MIAYYTSVYFKALGGRFEIQFPINSTSVQFKQQTSVSEYNTSISTVVLEPKL